jgi:hypothetical protein
MIIDILIITVSVRVTFCFSNLSHQYGGSNMTGTDLCVNKSQFVLVIFEPPCIKISIVHLSSLN